MKIRKNSFTKDICDLVLKDHALLISLARRDFKNISSGSMFGVIWLLLEPLIYIIILWFFFSKSTKFTHDNKVPFLPWIVSGIITWNFISRSLLDSADVFKQYNYLVKRWDFNSIGLPLVKVFSAFYTHFIFTFILFIVILTYRIPVSLWWLQIFYYQLASIIFLFSVSLLVASLSIFVKDVKNILQIGIQLGFWVSPIFWNINSYDIKYQNLLKINPLYHLIMGYRNSFIYQIPFWHDLAPFIYFWLFTLITLLISLIVYNKLRPHFGDVL